MIGENIRDRAQTAHGPYGKRGWITRETVTHVRLSDGELAKVQRKAARAGLSVSAYIRLKTLGPAHSSHRAPEQ